MNRILSLWLRCKDKPFGRRVFAFLVCRKAPYFSTIKPRFQLLEPRHVEISMKKRRSVENHIGTVHAIAMCNLCELAAGTMMEASLPSAMRWLPKGMAVNYLKRAESDVTAFATMPEVGAGDARDVPVAVAVKDAHGAMVCSAIITMCVSPRKAAAK